MVKMSIFCYSKVGSGMEAKFDRKTDQWQPLSVFFVVKSPI